MANSGSPPIGSNGARPAWLACLLSRLADLAESSVRRAELIAAVQERTQLPSSMLERAYDVAEECGLDPALALEMVGCGVAVVELESPVSVAEAAHSSNPPDWVAPPLVPNGVIVLERRLRLTFRRMRTLLERVGDLPRSIEVFAREPDVRGYDYRTPAL